MFNKRKIKPRSGSLEREDFYDEMDDYLKHHPEVVITDAERIAIIKAWEETGINLLLRIK